MTLTILDPRSGDKVTIWMDDVPAVRQLTPAKVTAQPRFAPKRTP